MKRVATEALRGQAGALQRPIRFQLGMVPRDPLVNHGNICCSINEVMNNFSFSLPSLNPDLVSLFLFIIFLEKGRFFRFRLPAPLSMLGVSKQSLPQEDPDVVTIHSAEQNEKHSSCSSSLSLSLSPRELHPPTGESCSPSYGNDTQALIGQSCLGSCSPISGPQDHSSPRGPWERPDPQQPAGVVSRRASQASMCTFRRASSNQDLEGLSTHTHRDRHASEGTHKDTQITVDVYAVCRMMRISFLTLELNEA